MEKAMSIRPSVVAGRFYPARPADLLAALTGYFAEARSRAQAEGITDMAPDKPCMLMLPHAGYVFSAPAAAATLINVAMPETIIILCPNHTGYGRSRFGVWTNDSWDTPLGAVPVNHKLALRITSHPPFAGDTLCHLQEHSIEVQLPLLQFSGKDFSIVPVCIASQNLADLARAAIALVQEAGEGLRNGSIGILVSSDMNHYEDEATTLAKDQAALDYVLAEDAEGLLSCCARQGITMCGAGPMALGLLALQTLRSNPSRPARVMAHATSGKASGDYKRVVGYAGVRFYL